MAKKEVAAKTFASRRLSELYRQYAFAQRGLAYAQMNLGHLENELWREARALGMPQQEGYIIEWNPETETATARKTEKSDSLPK